MQAMKPMRAFNMSLTNDVHIKCLLSGYYYPILNLS